MAEARRCRATRVRPAVTTSSALDDLHFIRQTLENSGSFTAVPGWGMVGLAATALVAAGAAWRHPQFERWMIVWLAEGVVALALAAVTSRWQASLDPSAPVLPPRSDCCRRHNHPHRSTPA